MSRWHIFECALWCALLIYGLEKVFTLSFFLLLHFPLSHWMSKEKKVFSWCFQWKDKQLDALLHNFRVLKKINPSTFSITSIQFYVGKGGAFHGLLYSIRKTTGWVGSYRCSELNQVSMRLKPPQQQQLPWQTGRWPRHWPSQHPLRHFGNSGCLAWYGSPCELWVCRNGRKLWSRSDRRGAWSGNEPLECVALTCVIAAKKLSRKLVTM